MVRLARPNFERTAPPSSESISATRWFWRNFWSTGSRKSDEKQRAEKRFRKFGRFRRDPVMLPDRNAASRDNLNDDEKKPRTEVIKNGKQFCHRYHPGFVGSNFCHHTNSIMTTKYTLLSFIPKNLFEQFHRWGNFYFLLLIILNWVPFINAFAREVCMIPLLIVLGVLGFKDLMEDVQRYKMDCCVNNQPVETFCQRIRGEHKVRTLLADHVLHNDQYIQNDERLQQIKKLHATYASNRIRTTKYTLLSFLPKNLFEQFHRFANCYFVFIILLNFVPAVGAVQPFLSMGPVIVILLVQAFKDSIEDYGRYKNDKAVNNLPTEVYKSSDSKYHEVKWKDLQVGDIVRVLCNSVIPADLLLLNSSDEDGVCYIETSNVDGENNLKQRTIVKQRSVDPSSSDFRPEEFKSIIECQAPNSEIYKFHGNIIPPDGGEKIRVDNNNLLLRGCVIRNTDYVEGIVIYAGHETKAMLNNNGPRYKRSKLERRMNCDVIYCVIMLVVMCVIGAVGNSIWASYMNKIDQAELFIPNDTNGEKLSPSLSGFYMFWTMVILLQVLIPISLYVSIELVKWAQVYMINNDVDLYHEATDTPMQCRALNITEDLGQIQYVFSDKTGTLTENQMVFRRCTVGGIDYPHAANAARIENAEPVPAYMDPSGKSKRHDSEVTLSRDNSIRHSYRRPMSGSIRPHLRKQQHSINRERHLPGHDEVDGATLTVGASKSEPNSPLAARKNRMSVRKPATHHRRNISSVSAREVLSTIASDKQPGANPDVPIGETDDDEVEEDLETDVTPDPVLYDELLTITKSRNMDEDMTPARQRILDFFINLAICNTVVLSTETKSKETETVDDTTSEVSQQSSTFGFLKRVSEKLASPSGDQYKVISSVSTSASGTPVRDMTGRAFVPKQNGNLNNSANIVSDGESSNSGASAEDLSKIRYEAESPDEAALVYAAHAYGCVLTHRSSRGKETVTVTMPNNAGTLTFDVLQKLPFDSGRKRMSVIVRDPRTNEITLYCKGADSAILDQLRKEPEEVEFDLLDEEDDIQMSNGPSNSNKVMKRTEQFLNAYARNGLRTLCISKKVIKEEDYAEYAQRQLKADHTLDEGREQLLQENYKRMETNLELLGATGIEDRLQEGVPETIEALRQAGIQVWVVTGDKQETAINIGYSCRLIHQKDEVIVLNADSKEDFTNLLQHHVNEQDVRRGRHPEPNNSSFLPFDVSFILPNSTTYPTINDKDLPSLVLVIDGKTLAFALEKEAQKQFVQLARRCRCVLCCRATPIQKGAIVKLIRDELHVMTLAIGDGANDVSMIQVADVGIGLSGQEGMQAVMSSDYALAQFRFLKKLLLVHGHWNYARLAVMVLYFFYKNAAFVFLIFWFQIFCGFSGANPIEQYYLLFFSLLFTSVPPLINGVLDRDITEETLMNKPSLYKQGIKDELYKSRTFWINILDAVYQSLVVFFFAYFTYLDSDIGMIEWGTPVTTAALFVQLIHLGIETTTWTWIHWVGQIGSILIFFGFSLIYNIACPACSPPSNPYYVMETVIQTGEYWFYILLSIAVALFPRYVIRALQASLYPTECQRERAAEKKISDGESPISTASTSCASSSSSTHKNPTYNAEASPAPQAPPLLKRPNKLSSLKNSTNTSNNSRGFYGGSTPDLSSKASFYQSPNYNSNNSKMVARGFPSGDAPVNNSSTLRNNDATRVDAQPSAGMYVNLAYHGLSDDDDDDDSGNYDDDTGESLPNNSRAPRTTLACIEDLAETRTEPRDVTSNSVPA